MDSKNGLDIRQKADLLKGGMNYREHYDYLMDWYVRDRKQGIPEAEMKESLKDVLEALKELNARVDAKAASRPYGIFSRLVGQ